MVRILIITAWYYPFIHPRAHRWTSLAMHWAVQGHDVHVLCARRRECLDESVKDRVKVHRVGFDSLKEVFYFYSGSNTARGRVGVDVRRPGIWMWFISWLYSAVWKKIYFPDDACLWYFPARKKAKELLALYDFDAIISVSLPFTGHLIGNYLKGNFPKIRWLADIGDPFALEMRMLSNGFLFGRRCQRLEKKVLEKSDAVVVTNRTAVLAYRDMFPQAESKISVIPPLFHSPGDTADFVKSGLKISKAKGEIHLGYFGALYKPVRTPDAFLKLLEKTFAARPELKERLEIHFYGDVFPEFHKKLQSMENIQLHGLRSRQEVQLAMQQMDILVSLGNTTAYQLPSKSVDYLAANKPVVHLSFVEKDPFVEFWDDAPGLRCLNVRDDNFFDAEFQNWLNFLSDVPVLEAPLLESRIRRFTIEPIAEAYLNLLLKRFKKD